MDWGCNLLIQNISSEQTEAGTVDEEYSDCLVAAQRFNDWDLGRVLRHLRHVTDRKGQLDVLPFNQLGVLESKRANGT